MPNTCYVLNLYPASSSISCNKSYFIDMVVNEFLRELGLKALEVMRRNFNKILNGEIQTPVACGTKTR